MKSGKILHLSAFLLLLTGVSAQQADNDAFTPFPETVTLTLPRNVPPELKLPAGDTAEDNRVTRFIKDKANVLLKYPVLTTSREQYEQRINLMVASGDIPDAMHVNAQLFAELAEGGLLEDLAPYYDDNASPLLKEIIEQTDGVALERATVDGQLLAIPSVIKEGDGVNFMWIRQDWLDNLGLEAPETLEELHEVARAFTEDDPDGNGQDDTVGFGASTAWQNDFAPIFGAYSAFPGQWVENSAGKAVYGTVAPEMKEALATLQSWYQEGLIDPEFATLDSEGLIQKASSGRVGIIAGPWWYSDWPLKFTLDNVAGAVWTPYLTPLAEDGSYPAFYAANTGYFFVVRKGYEHPEAAFKVVNLQAEFEAPSDDIDTGYLTYSDQPELNVIWGAVWPLQPGFTRPDWLTFHATNVQNALESGNPDSLSPYERNVYRTVEALESGEVNSNDWGVATAWTRGIPLLDDERIVPHREVYQAETIVADNRIWPTMVKREDETMLRILTGQLPVDTFDSFTQEWDQLGGAEILAAVQEAVAE